MLYCLVVSVMPNPPLHPSLFLQQNPPLQPAEPLRLPSPASRAPCSVQASQPWSLSLAWWGCGLSFLPASLLPLSAPKFLLRCSLGHGLQFKHPNGSLGVIKAVCVLGVKSVLKRFAGWRHKSTRASTEQ